MKILDKSTLSEQVADILREQIIHGEYKQGEKILEEHLSMGFDVSRATIREALRLLETEGLLDREVNKYTRVHQFTSREIRSLFSVRRMLEEQAVDYCLEKKIIPKKELEQFIARMNEDTQKGWSAWNEFLLDDVGFHRMIIYSAGNPYVLRFWEQLQGLYMMAVYMLRKYKPDIFFATGAEHRSMLDALLQNDGSEWKRHLRTLEKDVASMTDQLVRLKVITDQ